MIKNFQVRRFSFRLLATFGALVSLGALASVVDYHIKKGDTLSRVLHDRGLEPLYGKNGFIKLTAKLNKIKKSGDFVRAGEIIKLPVNDKIESKIATIEIEVADEKNNESKEEIIKKSRTPSDEYPYSRFVYSPHLSFLRVDATNDVNFGGSSASALSEKGAGIDLSWHIFYDDRFSFFGLGSLNYFSFYKDSNYSLNHTNITRLHFGVGGIFEYSPGLKLTSKVSLREVSFLDVITPTTVNLESLSVPEIEVGLEKTVFAKKQLTAIWDAHLLGLLPSSRGNYKSKLGYGAGSSFEVVHKNKALFLNYDFRSLKVNEIKNKESSIVFGLKFFGENVL